MTLGFLILHLYLKQHIKTAGKLLSHSKGIGLIIGIVGDALKTLVLQTQALCCCWKVYETNASRTSEDAFFFICELLWGGCGSFCVYHAWQFLTGLLSSYEELGP